MDEGTEGLRASRSRRGKRIPRVSPLLLAAAVVLVAACSSGDRLPRIDLREISNGRMNPPAQTFLYEPLHHPRLQELREREGLEDVVSEAGNDFERITLLRTWARNQWDNQDRGGQIEPYYDAIHILKNIRNGSLPGGMCSEYSAVLMQACLAMGIHARLVSVESRSGAGHRVVEAWSDDHDKWVVMDPLNDLHYELEGTPLKALELHDALVAGRAGEIDVVQGAGDPASPGIGQLLDSYFHVTILLRNNFLSSFDRVLNNYTFSYRDQQTNGRPDFSRFITTKAEDLYWPLNQTRIDVMEKQPRNGVIEVAFATNTPGFERFEARLGEAGAWREVESPFTWQLNEGDNLLSVRAVNVRGVRGPTAAIEARLASG